MPAMTDAFAAATGTEPAVVRAFVLMALAAILILLLAVTVIALWDDHQDGQLEGGSAMRYGIRAAVLVSFVLAALLL